jgi:polysaccharide pyruvyl transferase WcaK-like protein
LDAVYPKNFDKKSGGKKAVGVNVNGLMFNGGYTRGNMFGLKLDYREFIQVLIKALAVEHSGEIWLIPHTYGRSGDVESDNEANNMVLRCLPDQIRSRVKAVNHEYDCHEIKGIIGNCEFFVGSRMHSCIAALSQGVPCVGVAYSMKFKGVFESVGMEDWVVDGRSCTEEQAVDLILRRYRAAADCRYILAGHAEEARTRLKRAFGQLFQHAS